MGMGNKLDPTKIVVTDIHKTHTCPLAKVMRKELKDRRIKKLKVVYSEEQPTRIKEKNNEWKKSYSRKYFICTISRRINNSICS